MSDLQIIPVSMYGTLCELLKEELPTSLKIYSILTRSHNNSGIKCYAKVVDGKPDPAIVVIKNSDDRFRKFGFDQDVFIYTHNQDQLNKTLENKAVIDMSKIALIRGVRDEMLSWYTEASKKQDGQLHVIYKFNFFHLDNPKKLIRRIPQEVSLGPITEMEHIHRMKVSWLYREFVSNDEFKRMMLSDIATGLFLHISRPHSTHQIMDSRHLVSWAVCNLEGSISLVTTVSEHQNKGYSKLVISELCHQLQASGRIPVTDIDERNTALQQLFESLGFVKLFQHSWVFHVPDNHVEVEKFNKLNTEIKIIDQRVFKPASTEFTNCSNSEAENKVSTNNFNATTEKV